MILALGCVVVAAAGCGVPGSREPERLGDAPGVGGPAAPAGPAELPQPARDITPIDLVLRFLQTGAAADWDPAIRQEERIPAAVRHARRFLNETGIATWKAGTCDQRRRGDQRGGDGRQLGLRHVAPGR